MKQESLEYFINTVIANHGDIYSFEKTIFAGSNNNVIITCKKHKCDINVKAVTLLRRTERNGGKKKDPIVGSCPMCREEYFEQIKNEMYQKFKAVHNNEYEYEGYINTDKSFFAVCKKHGKFPITANNHLSGKGKCPLCHTTKAFEKFVDGKRFYVCEIHGDVPIGLTRPLNHGCPKCAMEKLKINNDYLSKNSICKRYENDYDVVIIDENVILSCKKHKTIITLTRKEIQQKRETKYLCDDCLVEYKKDINDTTRINLITTVKEILLRDYSNVYTYIDFIDKPNIVKCEVKLLNIHTGKERIVRADTITKNKLAKTHRYILRNYMSFEDAKTKMRILGINSFREYKKWYKRTQQTDLPTNPQREYKEWTSYCDFFGTNPKANMSWGENRIDRYLIRKNIEFIWQKRFRDCRDKMPLPFDFYVPKYNLIIEFDGEQHHKETIKYGKESFEKTQRHDVIKNKYCKDNDINIIRLTYDDLINNVLEWAIDNELSRIGAEMALK
jgi:very-short-patch-repair endonuclease